MTSRIIPSRPFDHPAAWTVADIGCKDAFAFDLTDRHIAAFEAATQGVRYHKGEGGITPQQDKELYYANRNPAIDSAQRRGSPL